MATSTLLQKLDSTSLISNVSGSPGSYTNVGVSTATMNRSQTETFIAKETVAIGDWVAFDYAATLDGDVTLGIFKADGNSSPVRTPFGVVLGSADTDGSLTAGSKIIVCIAGVCDAFVSDNAGAGLAIGALLQITNTAGLVDLASAASAQPVCGILAETVGAGAGNTQKRVVVIKQF
jgi:hypothetical protein